MPFQGYVQSDAADCHLAIMLFFWRRRLPAGKISVIRRPKQTFPIGCAVHQRRKHTLRLWHWAGWSRVPVFTHQEEVCCRWVGSFRFIGGGEVATPPQAGSKCGFSSSASLFLSSHPIRKQTVVWTKYTWTGNPCGKALAVYSGPVSCVGLSRHPHMAHLYFGVSGMHPAAVLPNKIDTLGLDFLSYLKMY